MGDGPRITDTTTIDLRIELSDALDLVHVDGELNFTWRWRIDDAQLAHGQDGWLICAEFYRPDRETGVPGWGRGRPLFVRRGDTAHDVWRTAFAAIKGVLEHELAEGFHVGGRRVFDPHGPMRTAHQEKR